MDFIKIISKLIAFAALTVVVAFSFAFWLTTLLMILSFCAWLYIPIWLAGFGFTSLLLVFLTAFTANWVAQP